MRIALDIGPLVAYFWAFRRFSKTPLELFGQSYDGLVAAMIIFVPAITLAMAISYITARRITRMQVFTLILTIIIGAATLYFNDPGLVKLRPSIVNGLFAAILGFGLFVQKRSYFQYLLGETMPLREEGWMLFTKALIVLFLLNVIINEIVRNFMDDEAFIWWDTIGQMGLSLVFIIAIMPRLSRYMVEEG